MSLIGIDVIWLISLVFLLMVFYTANLKFIKGHIKCV